MIKYLAVAAIAGTLFVSGLQNLQADFQNAVNDRIAMIDEASR